MPNTFLAVYLPPKMLHSRFFLSFPLLPLVVSFSLNSIIDGSSFPLRLVLFDDGDGDGDGEVVVVDVWDPMSWIPLLSFSMRCNLSPSLATSLHPRVRSMQIARGGEEPWETLERRRLVVYGYLPLPLAVAGLSRSGLVSCRFLRAGQVPKSNCICLIRACRVSMQKPLVEMPLRPTTGRR